MLPGTIQSIATFALHWIVAPLGLFLMFRYAWHFLARAREDKEKLATRAAFVAGFVIFLIAVSMMTPGSMFSWPIAAASMLAGGLLLWAVREMVPAEHVGWIVMILTATSLTGAYCFAQLEYLRGSILSGALGLALGVLLHVMMMPGAVIAKLTRHEQQVDNLLGPPGELEPTTVGGKDANGKEKDAHTTGASVG